MTEEELEQLKHKYWKNIKDLFAKEESMNNLDPLEYKPPQDEPIEKDFPQDKPLKSKDIPQEATEIEKLDRRLWVQEALMEETVQRLRTVIEWIEENHGVKITPCARFKFVKKDDKEEE